MAATPAFMSLEPRPSSRSPSTVAANGSVHALDAHGVEVAGEHHGGSRARLRAGRDQARAVGPALRGDDVRLEAAAPQPVPQVLDDGGLARGAGREAGVHRVDGDQLGRQRDGGIAQGVVGGHPATLRRRAPAR